MIFAIRTDWLQNSLVTSNVFDKESYSIQSEMSVVDYFMVACDVMSCDHLISFACTALLQSHVPLNWFVKVELVRFIAKY